MHIGIDGGCWSNRRGYGRFLRELLEGIARNDGRHTYTVFLDSESYASFNLAGPFQSRCVSTKKSVRISATSHGRRAVPDLLRMSMAVAREKLDLFFFPSVFSYFPLLRPMPTVLGIHDTIAERNSRLTFGTRRHELFWRAKVRLALLQATSVVTVSEYSRRCIEQWLHVPSDRIGVLYEAASPRFMPGAVCHSEHKYVLYVGGISPTKNLKVLIEAFSRCQSRSGFLKLVLTGDYTHDGFKGCYQELSALVAALNLADDVEFTGFVSDDELARLYKGAAVFAMPSLDEGFGLPAIEAMACGVPVIVSSGNAMEEVVGGAGFCLDAKDVNAWAEQIDRIVNDCRLSAELRHRGLERAKEFSWDRTAGGLLDIFDSTVERWRR